MPARILVLTCQVTFSRPTNDNYVTVHSEPAVQILRLGSTEKLDCNMVFRSFSISKAPSASLALPSTRRHGFRRGTKPHVRRTSLTQIDIMCLIYDVHHYPTFLAFVDNEILEILAVLLGSRGRARRKKIAPVGSTRAPHSELSPTNSAVFDCARYEDREHSVIATSLFWSSTPDTRQHRHGI